MGTGGLYDCRDPATEEPEPSPPTERQVDERRIVWLLSVLAEHGGDPEAVLRRVGLIGPYDWFVNGGLTAASSDLLTRISAVAATEVGNLEASKVGREPFRRGDWQLVFFCAMSARTLREAAERISAFLDAIDGRSGLLKLHVSADVAELRVSEPSDPKSYLSMVAAITGIMNLHGLLSWMIGRRIPVLSAELAHDSALLERVERDLVPLPLRAGPVSALRIPAMFLDYPVVSTLEDHSRRPTLSFLVALADPAVRQTLVEQARETMIRALRSEQALPSLDELAAAMELNRDTFRRRLRDAGSSYSQLKDSCRRELALHLLHRTNLSVELISDRLGFCDSDAFRRAVRSWVGVSPLAYRRGNALSATP